MPHFMLTRDCHYHFNEYKLFSRYDIVNCTAVIVEKIIERVWLKTKLCVISVPLFCDMLPHEVWQLCKRNLCCLKCHKVYSDWRSLRKHMNYVCQVEPKFPCPYCNYRARINTILKYHIMREHPIVGKLQW